MDIRQSLGGGIGGLTFGQGTPEYLFGRIRRLSCEFRQTHPSMSLLDFGLGEPFRGPNPLIRSALAVAGFDPRLDGYPDLGLLNLRQAVVDHFEQVFDVSGLDPQTNVRECWGIKSGLDVLARIFCTPGNKPWPPHQVVVAVTKPDFPIFGVQSAKYGAVVIELPVCPSNDYVPDYSQLELVENLHAICLASPHNPTGRAYDQVPNFWENLIEWCREKSVALIVDEAYCHLRWIKEQKPFTALSLPGFIDVGIVCQSASKTFNWTGGRIGWLVGNSTIIAAYAKELIDSSSSQTLAIQAAGAKALQHFRPLIEPTREQYALRLQGLIKVLKAKGFAAQMPDGAFYLYCPAPKSGSGRKFANADECMQHLLNAKGVVTVPFGNHLRFSVSMRLTQKNPVDFNQALEELGQRLPDDFEF